MIYVSLFFCAFQKGERWWRDGGRSRRIRRAVHSPADGKAVLRPTLRFAQHKKDSPYSLSHTMSLYVYMLSDKHNSNSKCYTKYKTDAVFFNESTNKKKCCGRCI